jgi:hypothetical protein
MMAPRLAAVVACACLSVAVRGHGEMEYRMAQPPQHANARSSFLEHSYRALSDLALRFPTERQRDVLRAAEAIYQVLWAWRSAPPSADEVRRVERQTAAFWRSLEAEYPAVRVRVSGGRLAVGPLKPIPVARGIERGVLVIVEGKGRDEREHWYIVALKADTLGAGSVETPVGNLGSVHIPVRCVEPAVLSGTILDADRGKPWPGRVHVRCSDGILRHGEAFKANETLSVKPVVFRPASYRLPFFYSDGTFEVHLPPGRTRVTLERGFEEPLVHTTITLKPGERREVTLRSRRGMDMRKLGWISGDTHVHWVRNTWDVNEPLELLPMVQRAEDIRVINNLTLYQYRPTEQGGAFIKPDHYPMGPVPGMCDAEWHVQMAEEYRNDNHYGHINLLGIRKLIEPIATGAGSGGPPGTPDWPTNRPAIHEARQQGGISIEAHNIGPFNASAVPVHVALGLADSLDQLDAEHYYRFLNCGFHIGLSNGSDHPARVVGCARVYARMPRRDGKPLPFTYERWIEAVRRGRTFTTSGPLLLLNVNNAEPGDTLDVRAGAPITIELQAWSRKPLGTVQIVSNGEVLKSARTSARTATICMKLTADQSRWFCARASLSGEWNAINAPDVAHTSAVFVRLNGREVIKPDAARFWIANIQEHIRRLVAIGAFASDDQKRQALEEARQGLVRYEDIARRGEEMVQEEETRPEPGAPKQGARIRITPVIVDQPIVPKPGMPEPQDLSRIAVHIQAPWMSGPVELRFPETLRSSMGMHFLDHYRSDILPMHWWAHYPDWETDPATGGASYDFMTPEGLQLQASAVPAGDTVELTFMVTNRTGAPLDRVEANCCLDMGPCPELNAKWDLARLFMSFGGVLKPLSTTTPTPEQMGRQPWLIILTENGAPKSVLPKDSPTWWRVDQLTDRNLMAAVSADGKHLLGYTWSVEPEALMTNCGNPCLHTGTGFSPSLAAGESYTWRGRIYCIANDPDELIRRYERDQMHWLTVSAHTSAIRFNPAAPSGHGATSTRARFATEPPPTAVGRSRSAY